MNTKRTIQAIGFFGVALLTALAGCATSVSGDGGGGGTGNTCDALFSGSSCLAGCSGAEQACAAAGQSAAFTTFLSCASNAGFSCPGGQVQINNGNCSNESAAITACASGMGSGDAGPTPTTTGTPNPTGTGTTPPGGKDSGTGTKDSGQTTPPGDSGDPCTNCQNTATSTGGQCYSDLTTCENDPNCNNLLTCLGNCTSATCDNSCATTAGMTATNELTTIDNCICNTACSSQCASVCSTAPTDAGGPVDSGPPPSDSGSAAACMTCANTAQSPGGKCYTDVTACMNDQSCVTLVNCLNACAPTDMTCVNNCGGAASQSAITEYNNLGNCICTTACMTPCAAPNGC